MQNKLSIIWFARIAALCLLGLSHSARAAELTPAATVDDLDLAHCQEYTDGKPGNAPSPGALPVLLNLQPAPAPQAGVETPHWDSGTGASKVRAFRIAFTKPIELGTIYTGYNGPNSGGAQFEQGFGKSVGILKPGAAYPGDVDDNDQWLTLPAGELKTLPPGITTRALRFVDRYAVAESKPSQLGTVLLYKERYYSALALGNSRKTGHDRASEVWMGYWSEPQKVAAVLFVPLRDGPYKVDFFKPDVAEHPLIASEESWDRLANASGKPGEIVAYLPDPAKNKATLGLRLTGGAWNSMGTHFATVLPLVNLGEEATPPSLQLPDAPFRFKYDMPMNGFVAIDVLNTAGRRVRHLVAETARDKGPVMEPWDLKDDNGQALPPGEYKWKGIARPPFKNTYQLTVNNSGQPAWPAPAPGKGGGWWLGDHSVPFCAASMGDMVFLGCQVCEGGHTMIATDLDGNKYWGEAAVSWGFSGPERIAVDGRSAYMVNNAMVQRVDTQNKFKTSTVFEFKRTRELPGNGDHWSPYVGGAAAWGDKLYVSYNAEASSWLQPPFRPEDLDLKGTIPSVWLAKGGGKRFEKNDKSYPEGTYDEIMSFYSAMFMETMPETGPSVHFAAVPNSLQSFIGPALTGGPLANTLTIEWKKPISVGSLLLPDAAMQAYALKPGKPLPNAGADMGDVKDVDLGGGAAPAGDEGGDKDPFDADSWVPLATVAPADGQPAAVGQAAVAVAPARGILTQAIRFKAKKMPFALVMARRFEDVAPQAERVFVEGETTRHGGWQVTRDSANPIGEFNPAVMGLVWKQPVTLHGISLVYPDKASMAVDVWDGPENLDPKTSMGDDAHWKQVGLFEVQVHAGYWPQYAGARQMDFGKELSVRALRIRAILPDGALGVQHIISVVNGPQKAGFDSIVAYHHLGEDPTTQTELSQRIDEFQLPAIESTEKAKLLRHIPFEEPGNLAFDKQGVLYGVSAGRIVTVPMDDKAQPKVVIAKGQVDKPAGIAFDNEGMLYVVDGGPQVVKVFDPKTGKLARTVGTPGGPVLGPWDETRMDTPSGITVDSADKLWVTNASDQPKLVQRWSHDGKVEKTFYGPNGYGGGGWLDSGDRNVLNYNGMEFHIDWSNYTWKLASRLSKKGFEPSQHTSMPDRPVYLNGHRYLVGDPGHPNYNQIYPIAVVCEERNGIAVPLASAGNLGLWSDAVDRPELRKVFGKLQREEYGFLWWDKNGDGIPQVDEVQITKANRLGGGFIGPRVGEDLSLNFRGARLRPTGFTAKGAPMYDMAKLEILPDLDMESWTRADGSTFVLGNYLLAPDGKTKVWEYTDNLLFNTGFYASGWGYDRPPGVLDGEHTVIGHFKVGAEEYFVTASDQGDWFVYTGDGMLAGCIFGGPTGYGKRFWGMPDWESNKLDLSDVRQYQETYQGCVTTSSDGKVYAVAGADWDGVVRIDGLESLQRLSGGFTVGADDIEKTRAWAVRKANLEKTTHEAKVAKMPYVAKPMEIDGSLDDWPDELFFTIHDYWKNGLGVHELITQSQAALAFDHDNLYVAVRAIDNLAARNQATELKTLFKGGGAVDVQLGLDAKADPARAGAVPGDIRILIANVKGEPVVMLYNYRVPNAGPDKGAHYKSPVGEADIDVVQQITDAQVKYNSATDFPFVMEAAIPWKSLGFAPPELGSRLKGDVGLLQSDADGARTVGRLYWSGKTQNIVSDVPSEARIAPALWGEFYVVEPDKSMHIGGPEDAGTDLMP